MKPQQSHENPDSNDVGSENATRGRGQKNRESNVVPVEGLEPFVGDKVYGIRLETLAGDQKSLKKRVRWCARRGSNLRRRCSVKVRIVP